MPNFLISYPRSGNTWLRYCVEFLSERPTTSLLVGDAKKSNFIKPDAVGLKLIKSLRVMDPAILIKRHHLYATWKGGIKYVCSCERCHYGLVDQDKIVFLVRDFRESIFRHIQPQLGPEMEDQHMLDNLSRYMDLVYAYDRFKGAKMTVYYEDLITDPIAELRRICKFLGVHSSHFPELTFNLEGHKAKALQKYGASKSGGNQVSFHAKQADPRLLRLMNDTMNKQHSEMFDKHLNRYK